MSKRGCHQPYGADAQQRKLLVVCLVLHELDLHRPSLLGCTLQQRRFLPKGPALDVERLVVGQQTQGLPGLHLLTQFNLEFLNLEGEISSVGPDGNVDQQLAVRADLLRSLDLYFRGVLPLSHAVDLVLGQPPCLQLLAVRLGSHGQAAKLIVEFDDAGLRDRTLEGRVGQVLLLFLGDLDFLGRLEQFGLRQVQGFTEEEQREQGDRRAAPCRRGSGRPS